MENEIVFELTKDHIKLLQNLNISGSIENDEAWGEIEISRHYPFYDGELMNSIAQILDMPGMETDAGEIVYPKGTLPKCVRIYNELATALQVCLQSKSFMPGIYSRSSDFTSPPNKWKRKKK